MLQGGECDDTDYGHEATLVATGNPSVRRSVLTSSPELLKQWFVISIVLGILLAGECSGLNRC